MNSVTLRKLGSLAREVAVIVVGVSIALGADAAYERYQEGLERTRILRSLRTDLLLDSAEFEVGERGAELSLAATSALLAFVDDPGAAPPPLELARAVRETVYFPSGQKESATYREITASGAISLIDDPELRERLLRYYARSFTGIMSEMWAAYVSDVHGAYERSLREHLGSGHLELVGCVGPGPEYEPCLERASGRIDLQRLRADPVFVERLVAQTLWAGRFRNLIQRQSGLHRGLLDRVNAQLEGA